MDRSSVIGYGVSFLMGLLFGMVIAALLTPESGPEMRARIGEKAGAAGQQVRSGYERSRQWVEGEAVRLQRKHPAVNTAGEAGVE